MSNLTSIVIPIAGNGFGSRWADTELRFALRSVERHLTGYGDIFIIGHKPDWVKNVIHIPATDGDKTYEKEKNIFNKIMIACNDERVTEDFLFMNDDHFLLKDYVAGEFPYYCKGELRDYENREDQHGNTIKNTIDLIGNAPFYFDVHSPILYKKSNFRELVRLDWGKKYGYCIKTTYMLLAIPFGTRIVATEHPDIKINEAISSQQIYRRIDGAHWFSMGNRAREGGMGKVLQDLYPNRSKYE